MVSKAVLREVVKGAAPTAGFYFVTAIWQGLLLFIFMAMIYSVAYDSFTKTVEWSAFLTPFSLIPALLAGLLITNIVCGYGIIKFEYWVQKPAKIVAMLNLLSVPIGTIFGFMQLSWLEKKETKLVFKALKNL